VLCKPQLGHLSEGTSKINDFCYMLWDVTPLLICDDVSDKDELNKAISEVLEYALTLNHIACIESGLHGLGHMNISFPLCSKLVENFIVKNKRKDPRILKYAKQAAIGSVQ